jgi:phosphatidylglycerol lysyltransferase
MDVTGKPPAVVRSSSPSPRPGRILLGAALPLGAFLLALIVLNRLLSEIHLRSVIDGMHAVPVSRWLLAVCFAAGSYLALTIPDALALHVIGKHLGARRTMTAALMATAVGNNLGVAAVSGGSIRYRLYSAMGLPAADIGWLVGFCSLTFALGAMTLGGLSLTLEAGSSATLIHLRPEPARIVGVTLLALVVAYTGFAAFRRRSLTLGSWSLAIPSLPTAVVQVLAGCLDLLCAGATLYVLLPEGHGVSYAAFAGLYVLAVTGGTLSNVPGGLGVFESAIVALLPQVDAPAVLGSVLVYRVIYYLVPFSLALIGLVVNEARLRRHELGRAGVLVRNSIAFVAPQAVAVAVFIAGVMLLFSGALPATPARLARLSEVVPSPLLEASHLAGSTVGVLLLLVANGLYRRLDGAWHAAMWLLAAGIGASILKGFDYEEALVLSIVVVVLWIGRDRFDRPASLLHSRFSRSWIVAVALAIGASIFVGLLAFRHVPYRDELWWEFARDQDAPRMLRASLLVVLIGGAAALWRLLQPVRPARTTSSPADLATAADIAARSPQSNAQLVLLGDKQLLFDDSREAFVMYRVSGRSWIAMGDPVGPAARQQELVWRFRESCDRYGTWPVFYEVAESTLPLYIDAGLSLSKLGEEARVPLAEFSLEGSRRAALRQSHRKAERQGTRFSIVPPSALAPLLDTLQRVSDDWLTTKHVAEKGFSLGFFDRDYLLRCPCAVVECQGRIVAFANLWAGRDLEECSVDLMRHTRDAPGATMDFLMVEMMLWARTQGYRYFNLGMAPLSGLEQHRLAPLWHRTGALIYQYGEDFYNFEGLRQYKQKYLP